MTNTSDIKKIMEEKNHKKRFCKRKFVKYFCKSWKFQMYTKSKK